MGSAFFELGIGISGLLASQKGLTVTSNNITNANTKGYSRQVATQKASKAMSASGAGMIGTGCEVTSIGRIRDTYIDSKFRLQNNQMSEYKVKADEIGQISALFDEPSDTGINFVINTVFSTFQDLSINSSDSSYFENARQSVSTLLDTINIMGQSLTRQQSLVNDEIAQSVERINSIGKQIQAINIQINKLELNGDEASSLRDDRDLLVDQLSEFVNVETREDTVPGTLDNKHFIVKINGQELVNHEKLNTLVLEKKDGLVNPEDQDVFYDIKWNNGFEFDENSPTLKGKLKALLEVRDGNGGNQMRGQVQSVDAINNVITLKNVNRGDLGETGIINIAGRELIYTDSTYDPDSKTLDVKIDDKAKIDDIVKDYEATVGTDVKYRGIPYYINKLNEFVRTFSGAMNEGIYRDGTKIVGITGIQNGYNQKGESGIPLIAYNDKFGHPLGKGDDIDYNKMNIFNMAISREIQETAQNIAISASQNPSESKLDLILEITEIAHKGIFKEGEVADFMAAVIGEAAMDVNQANKYENIQRGLTMYAENTRSSVSGVVNNEEMTNLVKYQSIYKASSRIINVMNEVYDTLINGIFR